MKMNDLSNQFREGEQSDFKALLELASPELYEHNAFRLLELHVEATERDLSKRKQVMEVASRNKLPVPSGSCRIFPRTPAPDDHEIRECSHAIQDAERRLAHEFFWFWPLVVGQGGDDACLRQLHAGDSQGAANTWGSREHSPEEGLASKHNLAVLNHFEALQTEREFLNGKAGGNGQESAKVADAERSWSKANKYWGMVAVEQSCWSRVVSRIRAMDDKSLTTGFARRMEKRLPLVLTLITARLAIRFHETGKTDHARRHVARLCSSGFGAETVDEALRIAIEPTRSAIKIVCESAKKESDGDPTKGDTVAERLLDQTKGLLELLDFVLLEGNPALVAEHDQVALAALSCVIDYGNKTEKWKRTLELLDRLGPLATSTAAKERIAENRKTIAGNIALGICWFCGEEEASEKCAKPFDMYGDVDTEYTLTGYRRSWKHATIKVPRCKHCKNLDLLQMAILLPLLLGMFWGIFGGAILGEVLNPTSRVSADRVGIFGATVGILCSIIGIILGVPVKVCPTTGAPTVKVPLFRAILKKRGKRFGGLNRSRDDYPLIRKRLSEGWTFGKKPKDA